MVNGCHSLALRSSRIRSIIRYGYAQTGTPTRPQLAPLSVNWLPPQPNIDALRQCKEEILEAHRSGLSVHRIAQIFRERGVDISVPHLVRTIWRFIDEEERVGDKGSPSGSPAPRRPASPMAKERHHESAAAEETKPKPLARYQISEQPSAPVQEEEFAKQLRLARYLAAASLPPSRPLEPVREVRTPKQARPVTKARPKIKTPSASKKLGRKNWRKKGGGPGRWLVKGVYPPLRIGARSRGSRMIVEKQSREP
jgi:hypothetical protein